MSIKKATAASRAAFVIAVYYQSAGELYQYELTTTVKDQLAYETLALRLNLPTLRDVTKAPFTILANLAHFHIKHYPGEAPPELTGLDYDSLISAIENVELVAQEEASDNRPPSTSAEPTPAAG